MIDVWSLTFEVEVDIHNIHNQQSILSAQFWKRKWTLFIEQFDLFELNIESLTLQIVLAWNMLTVFEWNFKLKKGTYGKSRATENRGLKKEKPLF
jgi:hypothetical protein